MLLVLLLLATTSARLIKIQKDQCGCALVPMLQCSAEIAACTVACDATLGAACLACVAKMSDQCCLCFANTIGVGRCDLCGCGCKES